MIATYWAWGSYIFATAANIFAWAHCAATARALASTGIDGRPAKWLPWLVPATFSLILWPFLAAGFLNYDNDPSIFSLLLTTLLSWIAAFAVQFGVIAALGSQFGPRDDIGSESPQAAKTIMTVVRWGTPVAIGLTALSLFTLTEMFNDWVRYDLGLH